jgi:hypothetical protein
VAWRSTEIGDKQYLGSVHQQPSSVVAMRPGPSPVAHPLMATPSQFTVTMGCAGSLSVESCEQEPHDRLGEYLEALEALAGDERGDE